MTAANLPGEGSPAREVEVSGTARGDRPILLTLGVEDRHGRPGARHGILLTREGATTLVLDLAAQLIKLPEPDPTADGDATDPGDVLGALTLGWLPIPSERELLERIFADQDGDPDTTAPVLSSIPAQRSPESPHP